MARRTYASPLSNPALARAAAWRPLTTASPGWRANTPRPATERQTRRNDRNRARAGNLKVQACNKGACCWPGQRPGRPSLLGPKAPRRHRAHSGDPLGPGHGPHPFHPPPADTCSRPPPGSEPAAAAPRNAQTVAVSRSEADKGERCTRCRHPLPHPPRSGGGGGGRRRRGYIRFRLHRSLPGYACGGRGRQPPPSPRHHHQLLPLIGWRGPRRRREL